ncbi:hypothetical protein Sste5346_003183 [Sporothrix stenoceras]|uniref:NDT80 domain-containing protein n=1 Tax=Sporothrix stenoceras TaxID=5173 RepID=A0ABR3ZDN1_9PEZI
MQPLDDRSGSGSGAGVGSMSAVSNDQLAFRSTTSVRTAYDENGQTVTISVEAFLQGIFVLSREPLDQGQLDQDGNIINNNNNNNNTPGQTENVLTCYRRNRFQTVGDVFFSAWPRSISTKENDSSDETGRSGSDSDNSGQTDEIEDTLTAQLSAIETRDWTQVVILAANSRDAAESAAAGGPPELEWTVAQCRQNQRKDSSPAALGPYPLEAPISWDRLQFRSATANNGRKRREIRQRFRVDISLYATRRRDGAKVCLATASSVLLTVRGRSPKNFEARDDQLLMAMIDGRSTNLLRQRQQQQQHQLLQPHIHPQQQQQPPQSRHRHRSNHIDPLAQPQPVMFQEAPLPQPHPINNNANNSSDIAGSGGFIYSPTMWDWIDLNATALQGLDGYNQGMQGMGDSQVFSMPSVWAPAAADASILAAASAYDESQSFAFAPNLLSHDQLQASSFLPQQQAPPPPPPPPSSPPPRPPSFQSNMGSSSTTTGGYSSSIFPGVTTSSTTMAPVFVSTPVAVSASASAVPDARLPPAANKSNQRRPDTAAPPPATGPSPNAPSDSARTTTTVNSSDLGSTSTSTATGKNRYTYIPMGMAGWQPPAEPVYWAHPWIHMQGKKAVSLIYPPEIATKTTKQHFFQEVES